MHSFTIMSLRRTRSLIQTYFSLGLFTLLLTAGCRSDDDLLNLNATSGQIQGIVNDSMSLVAYTINEDSLKTDSLRSNLLGAMNDPEFGKSEASVATQIQLPEINIDFDGETSPDSTQDDLRLLYREADELTRIFGAIRRKTIES